MLNKAKVIKKTKTKKTPTSSLPYVGQSDRNKRFFLYPMLNKAKVIFKKNNFFSTLCWTRRHK